MSNTIEHNLILNCAMSDKYVEEQIAKLVNTVIKGFGAYEFCASHGQYEVLYWQANSFFNVCSKEDYQNYFEELNEIRTNTREFIESDPELLKFISNCQDLFITNNTGMSHMRCGSKLDFKFDHGSYGVVGEVTTLPTVSEQGPVCYFKIYPGAAECHPARMGFMTYLYGLLAQNPGIKMLVLCHGNLCVLLDDTEDCGDAEDEALSFSVNVNCGPFDLGDGIAMSRHEILKNAYVHDCDFDFIFEVGYGKHE